MRVHWKALISTRFIYTSIQCDAQLYLVLQVTANRQPWNIPQRSIFTWYVITAALVMVMVSFSNTLDSISNHHIGHWNKYNCALYVWRKYLGGKFSRQTNPIEVCFYSTVIKWSIINVGTDLCLHLNTFTGSCLKVWRNPAILLPIAFEVRVEFIFKSAKEHTHRAQKSLWQFQ